MTSIHFALDRSGSMYSCINDTIGGFNHFIQSQQNDNPNGNMSLNLFDHVFENVYESKNIQEVEKLNSKTYTPRGPTALLDAIGQTIKKAEVDEKPMIVILTDGEENSSTKYTLAHVKDLIQMKESLGWSFVFLGANQDAIKIGGMMGIPEESAMTFNQENTREAFEGLSAAIGRQTSGQEEHVTFTGLERAASQGPVEPSSPMSNSEVFVGLQRC